jgi:hypothetical protein
MGDRTVRYREPFDRETRVVGWQAPDGREFLVCGTGDGYALRSPRGWESDDFVDFEADLEGMVYCDGERVGWRIPRAILRRTVA